jgi:hypothetical protein
MSALLLTTAAIFAGGLCALAVSRGRSGLLVIACAVVVLALSGVRLINEKGLVTAWLLLGLLPALVGWSLLR